MNFILTTDTSCDELKTVLNDPNVPWIPLSFTIQGRTFEDDFSSDAEYRAFYKKLAGGARPTTSQITPLAHEEFFEKVVKEHKAAAIVHLSLSGGLSDTANSAVKGAESYMARDPKVKIYITDTFAATQTHNLLVREGIRLRGGGASAEEAYGRLELLKARLQGWFMVDDLFHLRRGGRISGASAAIGTVLNIKPVLILDRDGKLAIVKKVQGTSKVFNFFLDVIEKYKTDDTDEVAVIHANAYKNAELLKARILERYPSFRVPIGWLGPVIGAHCGEGMIGLTFAGKNRSEIK